MRDYAQRERESERERFILIYHLIPVANVSCQGTYVYLNQTLQIYIQLLGTWYSTLWNAQYYGKCFTIYLVLADQLCQSYLRGSYLLPSQLPEEHTVVLPNMMHSTFAIMTSFPYTSRVRNPVVQCKSDDPEVVFNVQQSHRHDSTHPSLFLPSWCHLYICGVQHNWA